jgi:hypothetical protein
MVVNTTGISNITSFQGLAEYTNTGVGGLLFEGGMVVFFIIMLVVLTKNFSFEDALLVSAWSMFTISLFFWLAHLISTITPLAFLFIAGASTLYIYTSR